MLNRILLALAALVLLVAAPTTRAQAQGYVVVVNAASGVTTIGKDDLSKAFLKKGGKLVAVDQDKASPVRAAFTKAVHGRPVAAIGSYWQQQIFAGKDVPPSEKGSDAEVLAFVRGNPNGVGYVSAGADLGSGVKVVTVQ